MVDILKSVLLGIIEGITEWLPISSTGHLIVADEFIKLNMSAEFMEMFNVVIQLGAILAVVVIYFKQMWPFSLKKEDRYIKKDTFSMWFKVIVAILPAAIIGIPLDDFFEAKFHNYIVVALALVIYGVAFIVIEKKNKALTPKINSISEISYKTALLIGCFQALSLIPGTSRSGSTILGAILLGVSRVAAAEFSFYMAVPVMFGASAIKLLKFGFNFTTPQMIILLVGMITAFVVSVVAIKFLISYIKKRDFSAFGYYRIVLGVIVLLYFVLK
ncbi:MAG: undecaprenyl-diphosphate phosphatase [Ruminococcaceae bacterium]|nr:undecaprenyl-diphosphate phosphatase [Oscillospiraceae bacterium]